MKTVNLSGEGSKEGDWGFLINSLKGQFRATSLWSRDVNHFPPPYIFVLCPKMLKLDCLSDSSKSSG